MIGFVIVSSFIWVIGMIGLIVVEVGDKESQGNPQDARRFIILLFFWPFIAMYCCYSKSVDYLKWVTSDLWPKSKKEKSSAYRD